VKSEEDTLYGFVCDKTSHDGMFSSGNFFIFDQVHAGNAQAFYESIQYLNDSSLTFPQTDPFASMVLPKTIFLSLNSIEPYSPHL